jgi:hypothetical protein
VLKGFAKGGVTRALCATSVQAATSSAAISVNAGSKTEEERPDVLSFQPSAAYQNESPV